MNGGRYFLFFDELLLRLNVARRRIILQNVPGDVVVSHHALSSASVDSAPLGDATVASAPIGAVSIQISIP